MISDERLIGLNYKGFIPGPNETEEEFLLRVDYTKNFSESPQSLLSSHESKIFSLHNKVKKPRWSWTRSCLLHLFDFTPDGLTAYFANEHLPFFQGAATWILEKESEKVRVPIIQVREKLQKGSFCYLYTLEEILSHEAAHAARVAFDENEYEEIFAYFSSSSFLRRIIGPLFRSRTQVVYLLSSLIGMLTSQVAYLLFPLKLFTFSYLFFAFALGVFGIVGLGKLFYSRRHMKRALHNLQALLGSSKKARFVLFRLTDREIHLFSAFSPARIEEYARKNSLLSLRWRMIYLCYFPKR